MKKKIIVFLLFMLNSITNLFSQNKDSLEPAKEMERLDRLGDSLHKVQLANDSAFRIKMEGSLHSAKPDIEEAKQKEIEQATQQVLLQHEKEQRTKRKTMLLAISAFLVVIGRMIFKHKKRILKARFNKLQVLYNIPVTSPDWNR